jgi:DNA-binding transcriptional LysR family regulator
VVIGQLDLAVVSLPVRSEELIVTPLFDEDLMLVVPSDHPLALAASQTIYGVPEESGAPTAGRPSGTTAYDDGLGTPSNGHTNGQTNAHVDSPRADPLPISALADIELLLPMPGTALRNEIDAVVGPTGVTLRPSIELDGVRMLASLTFDGYGPSILPAAAVPQHLRERFRLLPLQGFPRRGVGIVLRSCGLPSAPTRVLIDVLHETVTDCAGMPGLHPARSAESRPAVPAHRPTSHRTLPALP